MRKIKNVPPEEYQKYSDKEHLVHIKKLIAKCSPKELKELFLNNTYDYSLLLICIVAALVFVGHFIGYVYNVYHLKTGILWNSLWYNAIFALLPFIVWLFCTNANIFNFYVFKRMSFKVCIVNATLFLERFVYFYFRKYVLVYIIKIQQTEFITAGMIMTLAYLCTLFIFMLVVYIVYANIYKPLFTEVFIEKLERFKLKYVFEDFGIKDTDYDITCFTDMETGKNIVIHEKDRYLQTAVGGSSGVGKTSAVLNPVIYHDLIVKAQNRDQRARLLEKMLKNNHAYVKGKAAEGVTERDIYPYPQYQEEFDQIWEKYHDCGITVIVPNADLTQKVASICKCLYLDDVVHLIDPMPNEDGSKKEFWTPLNPFYVSPLTPDWQQAKVISDKAIMFTDLMEIIASMKGSTEYYFTSINRRFFVTVATILMYGYPIMYNRYPNLEDVSNHLNSPSTLEPVCQRVERHMDNILKNYPKEERKDQEMLQFPGLRNMIRNVRMELGDGEMVRQLTGLRTLVEELLINPLIRRLYCSDAIPFDFDMTLKNCEIALVNYAAELGGAVSTTLGLSFLISYNQAVLRRPGDEKIRQLNPNWLTVDEIARLMSPEYETIITFMRQYGIGAVLAYQTLSQFEKTDMTKFLKGVILTAGTQIIFGRCGKEEMEIFSELAGYEEVLMEQDTVSQTSIISDNPSYSYSTRTTPSQKNITTGTKMRYMDFREVMIFSVKNGRVVKPVHAIGNFVPKNAYKKKRKPYKVDWNDYNLEEVNITEQDVAAGDIDEDSNLVTDTYEVVSEKNYEENNTTAATASRENTLEDIDEELRKIQEEIDRMQYGK